MIIGSMRGDKRVFRGLTTQDSEQLIQITISNYGLGYKNSYLGIRLVRTAFD